MSNLKILLKNNLNILLGRLQGKKQRKSTIVALLFLLLSSVGILVLYSMQAFSMYEGLGKMGLNDLCLFHGILTALSIIVMIGVMRISGSPKNSDDDLLLSLPIKKRDIIISKTASIYAFVLFFSVVSLLPFIILYLIFTSFNTLILVKGIALIFLFPFFCVGLSYILDFIVTRLFNRFSNAKLFKSLFSVIIFIGIMALLLSKTFFYGTVNPANMEAYFSDRFLSNLFLNFILGNNILNLLWVLLVTLIPFVIGLILYSFNYGKSFSSFKGNKGFLKFNNSNSSFNTLVKKELTTYGITTPWLVNTIIGPIFILVLSVAISIMGIDKISQLISPSVPLSKDFLSAIICLLFCAMVSTTIISCSSISLEGKNFWLLKTSPINEKQLLMSKVLLQIIILEPVIIIGSIILSATLSLSFFNILFVFVLPTLLTLILSFAGVFINLFYPILDFEDETKVVKQSFASFITLLLGFALTAALYGIYYLFSYLSILSIFIICSVLYVVLLAIIITLLFTVGVKQFRRL